MATTLQSPGVSVSVIDESFYTPAAPGTVPLIFVATSANKTNSSGTGLAQGTVAANVGKVWTITSQRDLSDTFGIPSFITDANQNPAHGSELNEYGLQAAYSLLGVSSQAYVVRADVDLSQITGSTSIPEGLPVSGTYWLDTGNTLFGINEWDAVNKVFTTKTPLIIDDLVSSADTTDLVPNANIGVANSYAVVATSDNMAPVYYKNKNNRWSLLGSNNESIAFGSSISSSTFVSTCWATSWPTVTSTGISGATTGSSFTINATSVTLSADLSAQGIALSINSQLPQNYVGAKVNPTTGFIELYADARAVNKQIVIAGAAATTVGFTIGTYSIPSLTLAPHTQIPQYGTLGAPSGSVYVKTTSPGKGASWNVKLYNGSTNSFSTVSAPVYATSEAAIKALDTTGGTNIAVGTLFVESNYDHGTGAVAKPVLANFRVWRRSAVSPTVITGATSAFSITRAMSTVTTTYSFDISESVAGSSVMQNTATITVATIGISTVTTTVSVSGSSVVAAINGQSFANVSAILNSDGTISINHKLGGDIHLTDGNNVLETLGFTGYNGTNKTGTINLYTSGDYDSYTYRASNWKPLFGMEARSSTPYTDPADGTLWYDTNLETVDILIHNGTTWAGYQSSSSPYHNMGLDPMGPILSSTAPAAVGGHSDGTDLVDGDIWIDTSSTDTYGQSIYVWNGTTLKWVKQDPTDQTSEHGWVFHDARWATTGQATTPATIQALLASDYVDPDAPDPALYPRGTRLWNLRRSGFNIKKYVANYIDINQDEGKNLRYENDPMDGSNMSVPYATARWITISPNGDLGQGTFGRYAQRAYIVKALKAQIDTNQTIRDTDNMIFNLIATPGYTEVTTNMVNLNHDRGATAFVIGDTPFRLKPTGTTLSAWGGSANGALDNGETGAVTYDDYMGFFYPSGYTTDNLGNNIVVPPSHMMLRTMTVSDQIAYPWFAPSGIRRGLVENATSVGYLENGEFIQTSLSQNLRDVLYQVKINPIATLNGVGVTNFGNLTRAPAASALDRINVARLVSYVRRQLSILAQPFIFEPNDANTRREIKVTAESLLSELVGLRGLYDFIVVCDESNNTQARIDRNELWMDIAIEPVKAIEFIYIPLRLVSTGSIKAGTFKLA